MLNLSKYHNLNYHQNTTILPSLPSDIENRILNKGFAHNSCSEEVIWDWSVVFLCFMGLSLIVK
jgi:hypothetical protein